MSVEFRSAPPNTGIVFVRSDLPGCPRVSANVDHRIDSPRRTTLVDGSCHVEMVEHILAALAGLAIDNCEVHVDRPEMPACDGSSWPYVEALLQVGIQPQAAPARIMWITDIIRVGNEDSWVELRPNVCGFSVQYQLDYGANSPIGRQMLRFDLNPDDFVNQLSSARTFLLHEEAKWLQEQGLGTHVAYRDLLVFGEDGPIDNELRFEDECVRHKILDLVGDFALAGCRIIGQAHAFRSGHRLNAALVAKVLDQGQITQRLGNCA